MKELSEIVDDIDTEEIEPEPSLESENAYEHEGDVELDEEQEAAIDRILGRTD